LRRVVLPLPRNPERTVTGIFLFIVIVGDNEDISQIRESDDFGVKIIVFEQENEAFCI
jgi:hypothetical protein